MALVSRFFNLRMAPHLAAVLGASGNVGKALVSELSAHEAVSRIILINRRDVPEVFFAPFKIAVLPACYTSSCALCVLCVQLSNLPKVSFISCTHRA